MKVLMISTPVCPNCKRIAPRLEEYCSSHNIEFSDRYIHEVSAEIRDILISHNVKSAPAFIIYRGSDMVVVSGDDIFIELEKK